MARSDRQQDVRSRVRPQTPDQPWAVGRLERPSCSYRMLHVQIQQRQNLVSVPGMLQIGANDLEEEEAFQWVSGEERGAYDNWAPGEPNNHVFRGQDCVAINSPEEGQWNDKSCLTEKPFICEWSI